MIDTEAAERRHEHVTQHHYEFCEACDKPITVLFRLADTIESASKPPTKQPMVCPHCGFSEQRRVRGRILEVWPGHSLERPRR